MYEPFDLPVIYKGEELLFPAHLKQLGFTHCLVVDMYGQEVLFEPDEEQNYRAIVEQEKLSKPISVELLHAIAEAIERLLK